MQNIIFLAATLTLQFFKQIGWNRPSNQTSPECLVPESTATELQVPSDL